MNVRLLLIMSLHKKHNAEDVRLKARTVGQCPKDSVPYQIA
jgi:hypothetical protein